MKTKLIIMALLLVLPCVAFSQTADGYVAQGRAFLTAANMDAANSSFSNAVALASNHPTANVFYAMTRLLVLPNQPAGSNFLSRIGVPVAGRDIYNWTAEFPTDANGSPLTPAGVSASELTALLRNNALPVLIAAEANLAKVTDTNFTLTLTGSETRGVAATLDYGDIILLRAMLQAAEYLAYTTYSWNLNVQMTAVRTFYNQETTIEQLLTAHPNLLAFATTNDLNAAKLAFRTGASLYMDASWFIRNRSTNLTRLFNYDASQNVDEQNFRLTLTDLTNSLLTAVPLTLDTNYTVNLGAHFGGAHSLRSFLPQFRDNGYGLGTLPDATFGGLVSGVTDEQVEELLGEQLPPLPTIALNGKYVGGQFQFSARVAKNHGYAIQVSTNLTSWADYSTFFAVSNTFSYVDATAFASPKRFYRLVDRYTMLTFLEDYSFSGAADSQANFAVSVLPGSSYLYISMYGGTGDCDLYVKYGSLATLNSWNYRPYLHGNNEYVQISNPTPGTWYIMLNGYKSYRGVGLSLYAW